MKHARVQDVIFGLDGAALPDLERMRSAAGLSCPAAAVSSSLRALFFGASSILSNDVELLLVVGLGSDAPAAVLLASPEAVGRYNLLPRARIAARSLGGAEPALRLADIAASELDLQKEGKFGVPLLHDLLDELEAASAHWGLLSASGLALLLERI